MTYKPHVAVCSSSGEILFHVHAERARLLVRDGTATPDTSNHVRRIRLRDGGPGDMGASSRYANPQKYTFLEPLGNPVDAHCHALKAHIAKSSNWPIFRAAVVDCLPAAKQAAIRKLFQERAA
jgi:hypothetical protein